MALHPPARYRLLRNQRTPAVLALPRVAQNQLTAIRAFYVGIWRGNLICTRRIHGNHLAATAPGTLMRPPTAPPDHVNKTRNQVEQQQQQRNPRTSAQLFFGNSPRATRTTHVLSRTKHQRPSSHAASQRCSLIISTPYPLSLHEFAPFSSGAFPSYQKPHQQQKTTCCLTLKPTCCLIPTSNTKPCQTGCTHWHSDIGSSSSTPTPAEGQIPARSDALLSSRLIPQALRREAVTPRRAVAAKWPRRNS